MLKKALLLYLFFITAYCYSQETNYKEYSYAEFFQLIENEKDSVFTLKDAIVEYNAKTDSMYASKKKGMDIYKSFHRKDTIAINKPLLLDNVHILPYPNLAKSSTNNYTEVGLYYFKFKEKIVIKNATNAIFNHCTFEKKVSIIMDLDFHKSKSVIPKKRFQTEDGNHVSNIDFHFLNSNFKDGLELKLNPEKISGFNLSNLTIKGCEITFEKSFIEENSIRNLRSFDFSENIVNGLYFFRLNNNPYPIIRKNTFNDSGLIYLHNKDIKYNITDNDFKKNVVVVLPEITKNLIIDWKQWSHSFINYDSYVSYCQYIFNKKSQSKSFQDLLFTKLNDEKLESNLAEFLVKRNEVYRTEIALLAEFLSLYKSRLNTKSANLVYVKIKNLETLRSEYLYKQNPTFKGFFTWKINQFLKLFSAYGTEPARAVIFSLYVILFFAFIYLLFPNSWDSLGKKRLMHRFEFFQKYLRRKDGMHTLYLEDKQQEISSYEDFKINLEKAHLELPSFFIAWSKPLYNASMFSSKLTAKFLKNTDILNGK